MICDGLCAVYKRENEDELQAYSHYRPACVKKTQTRVQRGQHGGILMDTSQ